MNRLQRDFIVEVEDTNADRILIEHAARAMEQRMTHAREEMGYSGWHTDDCGIDDLFNRLKENVLNGAWVDVMNLAAMIHARGVLFGETPQEVINRR